VPIQGRPVKPRLCQIRQRLPLLNAATYAHKEQDYMSPHAKMPGNVSQRNPVSVFNLYLRTPSLYQRPGQTYRKYMPEDLYTFTLATTRHQSNTKYAWALVDVDLALLDWYVVIEAVNLLAEVGELMGMNEVTAACAVLTTRADVAELGLSHGSGRMLDMNFSLFFYARKLTRFSWPYMEELG
jgi:hypothetical protein